MTVVENKTQAKNTTIKAIEEVVWPENTKKTGYKNKGDDEELTLDGSVPSMAAGNQAMPAQKPYYYMPVSLI